MWKLFRPFLLASALGIFKFVRTPIAAQVPKGPFITGAPGAGTLDVTETACDIVNGNLFVCSGQDVLLIHNTDVGAQTFTVLSTPDQFGRTNDITAYSVGIGKISVVNLRDSRGWIQPDGNVYLTASTVTVKFAILKVTP